MMDTVTHVASRTRRRLNAVVMLALLGAVALVAFGSSNAGQDAHRVTRLELVDDEGTVALVLDVSNAGRPRISVIEGESAALFELSTTDVRIVAAGAAGLGDDDPAMGVSRIRFDALQALTGAVASNQDANTPEDSLAIRMRYLQEQIDSIRREQGDMERDIKENEPRGRDTSDPLRLQRVIDELQRANEDLQREVRDLRNDLTRTERDNIDLTRRVRAIESKIRE